MAENTKPQLSPGVQRAADFLHAVGLNPNVIITEHEDLVSYPGGAYMNRYVRFSRGENFQDQMTDLFVGWPSVSIVDLKQAGLWV